MLRFALATKVASKPAGFCCGVRAVGTSAPKKRGKAIKKKDTVAAEPKFAISYSNISVSDAEKRLGFKIKTFEKVTMTVKQMVTEAQDGIKGLDEDRVRLSKEKAFNSIIDFFLAEGYPRDRYDHKEANVNDMIYSIVISIFSPFCRETKRQLHLSREKEIISPDRYTGGLQEFVVTDLDAGRPKSPKFVLVVEAKRKSIQKAKKQCLLALKDMGDANRGGVVYGFVTVGDVWQLVRYKDKKFSQTEVFHAAFPTMEAEKDKWMQESSVIIDLIHMALKSVGPTRAGAAA